MDLKEEMAMPGKPHDLYGTMVYLADTLVAGFDVLDLADRLVLAATELIGADAAGLMLDDQRGRLRVLLASSEETHLLELLELQTSEGPCLESIRTGQAVAVPSLAEREDEWPQFVAMAREQGITGAYAFPMTLRDTVIGAMNLFCVADRVLSPEEQQLGRVLTSLTTIGIINHRTLREREVLAEQLQGALNSRVVIEQAKGVIAERATVGIGEAFEMLRAAARSTRRPLVDVAREVASGELSPVILAEADTAGPQDDGARPLA